MILKKSIRRIDYIVVHCTASKEGQDIGAAFITMVHIKERGWDTIGYNYVVRLDGVIELGRNVDIVPAQVHGYNDNAIALVYVGGVDQDLKPKDTRTDAQKTAIISLLNDLRALYPTAIIQGHRDFPGVTKACPSFDAKTEYKDI